MTTETEPKVEERLLLSLQGGAIVAVGLYALIRLVQAILIKEPNPATVIWSAHAGYLWRVWTACYAGGMAAFLAFAASKAHERALCKVLLWGLYAAGGLLVAQGLLVP
jgi:hypothetical protein